MTIQKQFFPKMIFGGICMVAVAWATITLYLESSAGLPVTRSDWGHRLIGWFINVLLVRAFVRGVRRYYKAKALS